MKNKENLDDIQKSMKIQKKVLFLLAWLFTMIC